MRARWYGATHCGKGLERGDGTALQLGREEPPMVDPINFIKRTQPPRDTIRRPSEMTPAEAAIERARKAAAEERVRQTTIAVINSCEPRKS